MIYLRLLSLVIVYLSISSLKIPELCDGLHCLFLLNKAVTKHSLWTLQIDISSGVKLKGIPVLFILAPPL